MNISGKVADINHLSEKLSRISFHEFGSSGLLILMFFVGEDWVEHVSVLENGSDCDGTGANQNGGKNYVCIG